MKITIQPNTGEEFDIDMVQPQDTIRIIKQRIQQEKVEELDLDNGVNWKKMRMYLASFELPDDLKMSDCLTDGLPINEALRIGLFHPDDDDELLDTDAQVEILQGSPDAFLVYGHRNKFVEAIPLKVGQVIAVKVNSKKIGVLETKDGESRKVRRYQLPSKWGKNDPIKIMLRHDGQNWSLSYTITNDGRAEPQPLYYVDTVDYELPRMDENGERDRLNDAVNVAKIIYYGSKFVEFLVGILN